MIVATFFTRLAPNDQYLPVLYIDQLGVIYRYLKVRYIIRDIHVLFTVMHLKHKEALFFFWGGGRGQEEWVLGEEGWSYIQVRASLHAEVQIYRETMA